MTIRRLIDLTPEELKSHAIHHFENAYFHLEESGSSLKSFIEYIAKDYDDEEYKKFLEN